MTLDAAVRRPFHEQDVHNVRLSNAPLVRVLAQVRWQEITKLKSDFESYAKSFALAISDAYPYSSESQEINVLITPGGPQQQTGGTIIQLRSADEQWRVYLSATFLTLETSKYVDIDDFCSRLSTLLDSLAGQVAIPAAARLGFRYVDRLSDPVDIQDLDNLVVAEVQGGQQVPLGDSFTMSHSVTESLFSSEAGSLLAKWATLPAGATLDASIEPASSPSWLLDLDAFRETNIPFKSSEIIPVLRSLAHIGYQFFRWAVQPKFLERFGAEE